MVARTEQGDANRPPGFRQQPGRDEAVAAVVAGSAQHDDRTRGPASLNLPLHSPARVLHQLNGWRAGAHSQAVGFAHLMDIQQRCLEMHRCAPARLASIKSPVPPSENRLDVGQRFILLLFTQLADTTATSTDSLPDCRTKLAHGSAPEHTNQCRLRIGSQIRASSTFERVALNPLVPSHLSLQ